jgi:ubiquinone/menaquinone biosynthesis methyltransferase
MTQEVLQLFSSIAPHYDRLNRLLSLGIDRRWRRQGVAYLKEANHVLDLCAGTLALSKELLRVNPTASVTAVDFSREMLDQGLRDLTPHPPLLSKERGSKGGEVQTECIDFYEFSRPPKSFDAAMCAYGLRNLDDNPLALNKIHQLLKPGGKFVILEFFRPDRWYTWAWHLTYAQFVLPTLGQLISRHEGAYGHLRDSVRGFYTLDQYAALLRKTGFEVKGAKRLTGGISGLIVAEKE